MAHLTLYPATMTPALWATAQYTAGLGRLPDAVEPRVTQKINGDWSFTMRYPINGRNYELLQMDLLVCAAGQLYRINSLTKTGSASERYIKVDALHIFYDLQQGEIANIETTETDPDGITQEAALTLILADTDFTVGTIDNTTTLDYLDILQKSPFWALKEQILALWGGELQPDNWTINIRTAIGEATRLYPIRRGRNIKGITYNETLDGTITRLHVSGYNGATFEDINDGKDYIDSANIANYAQPREGRVEFPDDDIPAVLLEKGNAHLVTVDVPQVKYDIDLAFLRGSTQYELYAPLESFGLGDTARIHHDFFDVDIIARNIGNVSDPRTGDNVKVTLGNSTKDLYKTLSDAAKAADVVESIVTDKGKVRAEKLQGTIDTLVARLQASGSYANAEVIESQGFLLENTNADSADFGALYLGCGILALASEKAGDNSWIWRTFGTGKGFTADEMVTGTLLASLVKITGTDDFFWDGDAISMRNVETHKLIKIGKYDGTNYGVGFSVDDGVTWATVLSFDGLSVPGGSITSGTILTSLVKISGTDDFYWDNEAITLQDTANHKIIKIGKYDGANYGIGFSTDDGETWSAVLSFSGLAVPAGSITSGTLLTSLVKILGTNDFYWDNDAIVLQDTANHKLIKIGIYGTNFGIGFSADDGATWTSALSLDGLYIPNGTITTAKIASAAQSTLTLMATNAVASGSQQLLRESLTFDEDYWAYYFPSGSEFTLDVSLMLISAINLTSNHAMVSQEVAAAASTDYVLSVNSLIADTYGWSTAFVYVGELNSAGTQIAAHLVPDTDKYVAFKTNAACEKIIVGAFADFGHYVIWEKPKLSLGLYAVGWSPHPEDNSIGVKTSKITIRDDEIEIKSGGNLKLGAEGSIALTSGNGNATINGEPMLYGGSVGRIQVSTVQPPDMQDGEIWIKPDTSVSKSGSWTKAALSSYLWATESNHQLTGISLGAGTGTYKYTVRIPIHHDSDNSTPYNVQVWLGGASGDTTVDMGIQAFTTSGWYEATVTPPTPQTWLGNSTSVWAHIHLQAVGGTLDLAIDKGKALSAVCEDIASGAVSGIYPCEVYRKIVVQ